jgi:hypothetical protein
MLELLPAIALEVLALTFLFIDELREIDQEAYAAALPVTRARPNSQT